MTKTKILLAAAALVAAPGLAMAECGWGKQEQVTQSCAPGTVIDAETGSCVAETTS